MLWFHELFSLLARVYCCIVTCLGVSTIARVSSIEGVWCCIVNMFGTERAVSTIARVSSIEGVWCCIVLRAVSTIYSESVLYCASMLLLYSKHVWG